MSRLATKMTCDKCGYITYNPSSMWYHRKTHNGVKPYKCQYCNYSALVYSTLTNHLKRRHGLFPTKVGPGRKSGVQKAAMTAIARSEPPRMTGGNKKKKTADGMSEDAKTDSGTSMLPVISSVYTLPRDVKSNELTPVTLIDNRTGEVAMVTSCSQSTTTTTSSVTLTSDRPQNSLLESTNDTTAVETSQSSTPSIGAPTIVGLLNSRSGSTPYKTVQNTFASPQGVLFRNGIYSSPQEQSSFHSSAARPTETGNTTSHEPGENQLSSSESDVSHSCEHESGHDVVTVTQMNFVENSNQSRQRRASVDNPSPSTQSHKATDPVQRSSYSLYSYRCDHCAIGFEDVMMYIIHMGCHNSANPFQCNACNHICNDKYEFASHLIQAEH